MVSRGAACARLRQRCHTLNPTLTAPSPRFETLTLSKLTFDTMSERAKVKAPHNMRLLCACAYRRSALAVDEPAELCSCSVWLAPGAITLAHILIVYGGSSLWLTPTDAKYCGTAFAIAASSCCRAELAK